MARSRSDWVEAALAALAEQGLDGVAVEPLARRLGATKGSFYWHFADRRELIAAVLELWERRDTTEPIEQIESLDDPRERLAALGTRAYASAAGGSAHASVVAAAAANPDFAEAFRRVTARRLAFLTRLYQALGLAPGQAARRARIAYAVYLGVEQLRLARLEPVDDLVDVAVELSLPPGADREAGPMIVVAGHVRVEAARRDEYLLRSREAVELARRTPGCDDFAVGADLVDPERVNVYERWRDRAALEGFRGDGPTEDLRAMIVTADVREIEVAPQPWR